MTQDCLSGLCPLCRAQATLRDPLPTERLCDWHASPRWLQRFRRWLLGFALGAFALGVTACGAPPSSDPDLCPSVEEAAAWQACAKACGGLFVATDFETCSPYVPKGANYSPRQATAAAVATDTTCLRACVGGGS